MAETIPPVTIATPAPIMPETPPLRSLMKNKRRNVISPAMTAAAIPVMSDDFFWVRPGWGSSRSIVES